jgi:hypothetical protein
MQVLQGYSDQTSICYKVLDELLAMSALPPKDICQMISQNDAYMEYVMQRCLGSNDINLD